MLTYDMGARGGRSLYEHLYRCIRHDVARGGIAPGERLPSKRALAKHLGVSVITVEAAYDQLVAEGYVRAEARRGYFACELAPALRAEGAEGGEPAGERRGGSAGKRVAGREATPHAAEGAPAAAPLLADFAAGSAATDLFPYATWAKTMRRTLAEESAASLAEAASAAGSWRLRCAIARYLHGSRGMDAAPGCIVVGAGAQALYALIVQLLGRGRTFAVEDPGYPRLASVYRALGACVAALPLDAEGVQEEALRGCGASVAHLMPAHHFPTGIATSAARRRALLNWAREDAPGAPGAATGGRYLIEDDYDGEFRLAGRPVPALHSIDAAGRVIHVGTFAKSLGAAFRIGYMVLPEHLAKRFADDLGFYANTVSPIDQLALARFIEDGHYERHANRLRAHARRTQDALVAALQRSTAGGRIAFEGLNGGLHFVMRVEGGSAVSKACTGYADAAAREQAIAQAALQRGVALAPMSHFFAEHTHAGTPGFVMNHGALSLGCADEVATAIAEAIAEAG